MKQKWERKNIDQVQKKKEKEKKLYWRNELYNSMDTERLDKKKIKGDKREKKEHSGKEND